MGIFGAMTTAISGLQAQSTALEHISDNIANSQTTSFKRTETSFIDVVGDSKPRKQNGGIVEVASRATNTIQGDILSSDVNTHMAINGEGYFIVELSAGQSDGEPVFQGLDLYTRRGDFEIDKNGFLLNGAGYYLKGLPVDPVAGNVSGTLPEIIRITKDFLPAQETTAIDYSANLPTVPATVVCDPNVANSELIDTGVFTGGTIASIRGDETALFLERSIAGGAVTAYDEAGNPVNVQLRWAKTDSYANAGVDTWNLFYLTDSTATGATPAWINVGTDYTFGTDGILTSPVLPSNVGPLAITVDGRSLSGTTFEHGTGGLTQFADATGVAKVTDIDQNGFPSGELNSRPDS